MTLQYIDEILTSEHKRCLMEIPAGDPVLVVIWNEPRLAATAAANPHHSKQSIINRILQNGGPDPEHSGTMFHFQLANMLAAARRDFFANARWVMGTTPELRQDLRSPAIDPVAETYEISRISKADFEYKDARFFYY